MDRDPCCVLDHLLALGVLHATDCLREGVIDEREWARSVLDQVKSYETKLRDAIRAAKEGRSGEP
jgi:hypothetical protein